MLRTLTAALGIVLTFASAVTAGTLYYPDEKNAKFEITFPEGWTTKFADDGIVHASAPNWEVYWILTVAKGDEKSNEKAEEAMTKQIESWIKDYTYDEKAIESKINDIDFWAWKGKGTDNYKDSKTFGKPVVVDYVEFQPEEGLVGHIVSFEDPALQAKHAETLKGILNSIKKKK